MYCNAGGVRFAAPRHNHRFGTGAVSLWYPLHYAFYITATSCFVYCMYVLVVRVLSFVDGLCCMFVKPSFDY